MIREEDRDANLPAYQCHKKVRALKISDIQPKMTDSDPRGYAYPNGALLSLLTPEGKFHGARAVNQPYIDKHNPKIGGYWVLYEDGYQSFSPAKAFEDGYTLIESEK